MCSKRRDRVFVVALWALFALGLVGAGVTAGGCTPAEQGGADGIRTVQLGAGDLVGQVEWDDGTVLDLATGVTLSGEPRKAQRIDIEIGADVLVNGQLQTASLVYHSERKTDAWMRCLSGEFAVMGVTVAGTFPLSAECGPPDVAVTYKTPFRAAPSESGGD